VSRDVAPRRSQSVTDRPREGLPHRRARLDAMLSRATHLPADPPSVDNRLTRPAFTPSDLRQCVVGRIGCPMVTLGAAQHPRRQEGGPLGVAADGCSRRAARWQRRKDASERRRASRRRAGKTESHVDLSIPICPRTWRRYLAQFAGPLFSNGL
jgi:hypothetical protein